MISVNPFKYGGAVTGEYFTDREEEINTLLLDLKSGQNVILYSPRRFGKTSLIWKVMSHLKEEGFLCIYIDLFPISSKREFAQKLASEIAKGTSTRFEEAVRKLKDYLPKITPKIVLKGEGDMEFDVKFEDREMNIEGLLTSLYDLPQEIAQKRKKKVIMVFDEFQQIGEIDGEEIEKSLRARIQHHSDVAYIFMGSKHHLMERIFNDKTRPFYKSGKIFTLRKIPRDKFFAFIENRLKETGIEIESTLVERALNRTSGHPHYTQMFMHEIWNESYPGRTITQDSIERALEQILLNEWEAFTILWDSLSPKQKNLLVALVDDEKLSLHSQSAIIRYELGSPSTVSKSLKVLENEGILEQEGGMYLFSDIFFKEWIKIRDRYPVEDYLKLVPLKALPQPPLLPVLHNQTPPEPNFVGRVEMLEKITDWYNNSNVHIGALIGWGGVGKSALARKWYDLLSDNNIQPDSIFWWGFYGNANLERFLEELLKYLAQGRIETKEIKTTWEKVGKIKEFILEAEYLIILDGLEEMQKGKEAGDEFGTMAHKELSELLKFFADSKAKGLCLITTRYPLTDIRNYANYQSQGVEHLEIEDARLLFAKAGVKGEQSEIDKVIRNYDGHALSLTLLSKYLVEDFEGDIKKLPEIPPIHEEEAGGKAHRILVWYDKALTDEQRTFMKIFSLFRIVVGEREFEGVFLPRMNILEFSFKQMVNNLCKRRLISKGEKGYTTHPLIKGYFESIFEEMDKRLCHKSIYEYFGKIAPEKPGTLDQMQPLFEQVYHGCQAGIHQEVFDNVYRQKVKRGKECFLTHNLGAWETDISLIQNFFADCDFQKEAFVTKIEDKSWLINTAGLSMMSLGRLEEVEGPCKKAIELSISQKDWKNASAGYQILAVLQILTGNLLEARKSSEEAIRLSRQAKSVEDECYSTAYLAYTLFLLGEMAQAGIEFEKAGALQRKYDPSARYLYSNRGIQHADFLLAQGRIPEALDVTNENLRICKEYNWIDDINLCHRSLAAIYRHLKDFKEAVSNAGIALEGARKTGRQDIEASALIELARLRLEQGQLKEAESTINQALRLCRRCGYKLYETDAELLLAKVMECSVHDTACIDTVDALQKAKSLTQVVYTKADEMHYHLAKKEASQLLAEIDSKYGEKDV